MSKKKSPVKTKVIKDDSKKYGLILFVISFLLYINTVSFDYALDDYMIIKDNNYTKSGLTGIGKIISSDMFSGFIENYKADLAGGRYRPLSQVLFAIEYEFFGESPGVGHFVNVLLYSFTPFMIFLLLNSLFKQDTRNIKFTESVAFISALVFAVHPIHTEAVANIKGRDEIMSLLLALTSFYYFIKYNDFEQKKYLFISLLTFFAALLSKENAITYLAVLPLALIMFRKETITPAIKKTIPIILTAILFIIIRQLIVGGAKVLTTPELMNEPFLNMNFMEKYGTVMLTLIMYLKLLLIPYPLTYDYYPYHIEKTDLFSFLPLLSIAIHLLLIFVAVKKYKSNPIVSFAIFYYFITLSIVSNLFFTIGSFMNERFVYMPSLAFALIAAYFVTKLPSKLKLNQNFISGLLLVLVGVYSFLTVTRNPAWQDNFTLMTTDVKTSTNSAFGNYAAGGQYYSKMKDIKDSKTRDSLFILSNQLLHKALEVHPKYSNAFLTLGNLHYEYNANTDSTIYYYSKALEIYPANYDASLNLARLYRDFAKDLQKAEFYLKNCIKTNSQKYEAYNEVGVIYYQTGNVKLAAQMFETAAALNNTNKQLYKNLYTTFMTLGDTLKAVMYLNKGNAIK
ncbi:MAG: glycosyltransferase family 39 protein [Candidatus Kapaibacterium sp.]